jgi:hypothetical protein
LIADTCVRADFTTVLGQFVRGRIEPAIAGVTVTMSTRDTVVHTAQSNERGEYSFGPLRTTTDYTYKASKDGYTFAAVETNSPNFRAFKLSELAIVVSV